MNEELVFNIWFIVDVATKLSTHFIIRCYNINGTTDQEKTDLLQKLAETDFKTAERIEFVGNARIPHSSLHYIFETDFEYFVQVAEKQLPPKQVCNGGEIEESKAIKQVFSEYRNRTDDLLTVGQERNHNIVTKLVEPVDCVINEFFIKPQDAKNVPVDDLVDLFCDYYKQHPCRDLFYFRDR